MVSEEKKKKANLKETDMSWICKTLPWNDVSFPSMLSINRKSHRCAHILQVVYQTWGGKKNHCELFVDLVCQPRSGSRGLKCIFLMSSSGDGFTIRSFCTALPFWEMGVQCLPLPASEASVESRNLEPRRLPCGAVWRCPRALCASQGTLRKRELYLPWECSQVQRFVGISGRGVTKDDLWENKFCLWTVSLTFAICWLT